MDEGSTHGSVCGADVRLESRLPACVESTKKFIITSNARDESGRVLRSEGGQLGSPAANRMRAREELERNRSAESSQIEGMRDSLLRVISQIRAAQQRGKIGRSALARA